MCAELLAGPLGEVITDSLMAQDSLARAIFSRQGLSKLIEAHRTGVKFELEVLGCLLTVERWRQQVTDARNRAVTAAREQDRCPEPAEDGARYQSGPTPVREASAASNTILGPTATDKSASTSEARLSCGGFTRCAAARPGSSVRNRATREIRLAADQQDSRPASAGGSSSTDMPSSRTSTCGDTPSSVQTPPRMRSENVPIGATSMGRAEDRLASMEARPASTAPSALIAH